MLQMDRVGKRYGAYEALTPTTLRFEAGEFTILLGPSGAGKSTLLRSMNLLTEPTSGEVVVDGLGRVDDRPKRRSLRRMTGFIFQQHQLIGRQTALANVLNGMLGDRPLWRSLLPWTTREVDWALTCLERVGLLDFALVRAGRLSGGQQQRVGVARALAQRPGILLADEPVASLDPTKAAEVLDLLRTICKEDGLCAVVSLHQIDLAKRFADRVVALKSGRVVFDAPPSGLTVRALEGIYDADATWNKTPQPQETTETREGAVTLVPHLAESSATA